MNVALYVVYVTRYAISWCNFNDQMWWYWAEWSRYEICLRAFYWQIRALNNAHSPYERSGFFLANYNGNIPFTLKRIIYGFNPVQEKKTMKCIGQKLEYDCCCFCSVALSVIFAQINLPINLIILFLLQYDYYIYIVHVWVYHRLNIHIHTDRKSCTLFSTILLLLVHQTNIFFPT